MQHAGRSGEGGTGCRIRQVRHAARATKTHGTVEYPYGHFAHADQLAGPAAEDDAGAGLDGRAVGFQALAQQLEGLLDASADDAV